MPKTEDHPNSVETRTLSDFVSRADYSLMDSLNADPESTDDGNDHNPRQVRSGHYVPVRPTPIPDPYYVAHSSALFGELGLSETLAHDEAFVRLFSGDISVGSAPMHPFGWATGYALSIYGSPTVPNGAGKDGNGYGDGRAISLAEISMKGGRRWELQLKGAGRTPFARTGDGRACAPAGVSPCWAQTCRAPPLGSGGCRGLGSAAAGGGRG